MSLKDDCAVALLRFVSELRRSGETVNQLHDRQLPREVVDAYACRDNTFVDLIEVVSERCYAFVVSGDAPVQVWVYQTATDLVDSFCLAHDLLERHAASSCQAGRGLAMEFLSRPDQLAIKLTSYLNR